MLKYYTGAVLSNLLPQTTAQIREGFTIPYFATQPNFGIAGRLIRFYLGHQSSQKHTELESLHKHFWQHQSPEGWYSATANRLETIYIPTFQDIIHRVGKSIADNEIQSVIEFGTGNGDWLAYLQSQWATPNQFIGIDLAEKQIQHNRQRHSDLKFEAADLTEWVKQNQTTRSIFVTHCGVLEYLSEESIVGLFESIRSNHPGSMLWLVEPIAHDFDLTKESHSRLQAAEFSYSHHYPRLLRQADFGIVFQDEREMEGFRMLCVLASE